MSVNYFDNTNGFSCIYFLGQAGFIFKNRNGEFLAIDPYLSDCVEQYEGHMGFKRLLPKIIKPEDVNLDYIIATHKHLDHFDVDSIPTLMEHDHTHLYASADCLELVKECGIDSNRVSYVKPGDDISSGNYKLHFVNCDHGESAPDAVGVIIEMDGKLIYETGDTCLRLDRVAEVLSFGPIDILIAPINGAYGNLNEEECATLCDALKPKLVIPCHYGMFASHGGDPGKFYEVMKKKQPKQDILLMAQGEILNL